MPVEVKRRRRGHDSDSDSGDEFFDRTIAQKASDKGQAAMAHTVDSLCARRAEHEAEAAKLEAMVKEVCFSETAAATTACPFGVEKVIQPLQNSLFVELYLPVLCQL